MNKHTWAHTHVYHTYTNMYIQTWIHINLFLNVWKWGLRCFEWKKHFLFMKLTSDWEDGSRDLHLREKLWRGRKQMCRKRRWGCSPDILDPTHRHEQLRSSFHKNKQCHFAVRPSEISYLLSRDNSGMADERDRQRRKKKRENRKRPTAGILADGRTLAGCQKATCVGRAHVRTCLCE